MGTDGRFVGSFGDKHKQLGSLYIVLNYAILGMA